MKFIVICLKVTLILCIRASFCSLYGQQTVVTGKVIDARTGEPLPYVSVYIQLADKRKKGTTTNFDGFYTLTIQSGYLPTTLYAVYLGYQQGLKPLTGKGKEETLTVNFQLSPTINTLTEVTIKPKAYVNPAWEILANVIKHKAINNPVSLRSYHYQNYNRIEIAVNNLSSKLKKRKFMKDVLPLMDQLKQLSGDDGDPILPVFVSENISDYYYQRNPERKTEHIQASKVNGIGVEDATLIAQLVGSTFQQYNFYDNYLKIVNKEFISPITDNWHLLYNYELLERNVQIDNKYYYKIAFSPKRKHDLAFTGIMWIAHDSYALYQIDALMLPTANLNFINKIKIQQAMRPVPGVQAWLPTTTRIVVDVPNVSKNWAGLVAKFYISNKNIQVNEQYPEELFKKNIVLSEDSREKDEEFWLKNRHDSLSVAEKEVLYTINTVKNLPAVKTWIDVLDIIINGYYKRDKVSYGPYLYAYGWNNLEGHRVRLGAVTNHTFSTKLLLGGYFSYGARDAKCKYSGRVDYIFSRKPWTQAGITYSHDIAQTGLMFEDFSTRRNNIFDAFMRNGKVKERGPFMQSSFKSYIQTDLVQGLTGKLNLSHQTFHPLFPFAYIDPTSGKRSTAYTTTEIGLEAQWTPGLQLLSSSQKNKRIALRGVHARPIITIRYIMGLKGVIGSNFNYHKFACNIFQKLYMGLLGQAEYSFTAGYIPSKLPYPLLENHLGNSTPFYNRYAFNSMHLLEFTSDRFVSFTYSHYMDGLIFNSMPLIKALNLRTAVNFNVLIGSLSQQNKNSMVTDRWQTASLNAKPYMEIGYSIENIFRCIRVDFIHRLTHLNTLNYLNQRPARFHIKCSVRIKL